MSITQHATIVKIEDGKLYLNVCREQACAVCKARSACSPGDSSKLMVLLDDGANRKVGDEVVLRISRDKGIKAILLAYLVPVALIIGALMGMQYAGLSEIVTGSVTLGVVVLYFIMLRLFRSSFEAKIAVEIE